MHKLICTFVLVQVVCFAFSKDLPANFKKCKLSDPDVQGCLKVAIQEALGHVANGIPSFKLPVLEPLRIEKMSIGQGTGPVQVVQNFKDVDLYNMTKVTITDIKLKATDKDLVLEMDVFSPVFTFKGQYDLNGKILVLPIVGTGPCELKLINTNVQLIFNGKLVEKKGKEYMKLHELTVKIDQEKVSFVFENLFNGDKQLGDAMNKVLNENDKDVFEDVKSGYEEFLAVVILGLANKIFEHVPYADLFPQ